MITETINLQGNLDVVLFDETGAVKDKRTVKNLVVAVGKAHIASRITSNVSTIMSHMAIGTANVAPATSQTFLLGENARVVLDSTTLVSNIITYTSTFPAGTGTHHSGGWGIYLSIC